MADIKWSAFPSGGAIDTGDQLVGLRSGANYRFNAITPEQVQQSAFNFSASTGADDAFIVTLSPAPSSLTDGLLITMSSAYENLTTTPTLQVNALTPLPIVLTNGGSLEPGDIQPNNEYIFIYNMHSNDFELINPTFSTANTYFVQSNTYNFGIDSGTANAYAVSLTPTPLSVVQDGMVVYVQIAHTNTGASTLAVNGHSPVNIAAINDTALVGGELVLNHVATFIYNASLSGGVWVLQNSALGSVGILGVPSGGTGIGSATAYAPLVGGTTSTGAFQSATTGSSGQLFQSAGASSIPSWTTATYPSTTTASEILYSSSTNVVGQITTADSAQLYTDASGVPAFTSPMTNGELLIGSTSNAPVLTTITAGTGISVTNGAGSITIASTATGLNWSTVTTNQTMGANDGYFANSGSQLQFLLPTTAAEGSELAIAGINTGGWQITQNANQSIIIGSSVSSTGTGGSVSSAHGNDSILLVCSVANLQWITLGGPQSAGLTII